MYYTQEYTVLSHDTGHNGEVHPSALCRYLQETADAQMRAQGPTYRELIAQGYSFVLSRINVQLYTPLCAYDRLTVRTWAYNPPRGVSFERYYQLYREDTLVGEGASVWALLDLNTQSLCRVGTVELHYAEDKPLPLATHFRLPATLWEEAGTRTVRYSDVDVNNHMNNTRYPDMLCDFLPDIDNRRVTGIQIHYVSEAPLGETLTVFRAVTEEDGHPVWWFETRRADGSVNVRARIDTVRLD